MSKIAYSDCLFAGCLFTTVLAAACLRWMGDLIAPWSVGGELNLLYTLCCCAVTLALVCMAGVCVIVCVAKTIPNWRATSSLCLGLILLGSFVYVSLPLMGALFTRIWSPEEERLLHQDCEWIRKSTLEYSQGDPARYAETMTWLDIDGDGDLERWEQIKARTGGIGFSEAVFIYEMGELTPRWCGQVGTAESFMVAWIRPINLDLDSAPEIWMRDAVFLVSETRGFLDFSAGQVREFDPRLTILLVLLPLRALPLLVWFPFRRKPIPSVVIAVAAILLYVLIS